MKKVGYVMNKIVVLILVVLLLVFVLSACNFPTRDNPPLTAEQALHTAAARTVIAIATERAESPFADATLTPAGLSTPTPPDTANPTLPATPGTNEPVCDRVGFGRDVTVPDNTMFAPGARFDKTWQLRNAGTCTWTTAYRVVFDSGDSLGAPVAINLPHNVLPNQSVDITIPMVAPNEQRAYTGYWRVENAAGNRFGTGDGNKAFWVKIVVGTTPVPFAVTGARTIPQNRNISATCPYQYNFTIEITTTIGGTVTYFLERSDGKKTRMREVIFDEGGTRSVSLPWEFTESFTGTVRTYIDKPNNQYFSPVDITLTCQ
jgi:hypothetical protein